MSAWATPSARGARRDAGARGSRAETGDPDHQMQDVVLGVDGMMLRIESPSPTMKPQTATAM